MIKTRHSERVKYARRNELCSKIVPFLTVAVFLALAVISIGGFNGVYGI